MPKMNFAILLCLIVVASAPIALCDPPKFNEKLTQLFQTCGKELNLSPAELTAYMANPKDAARATDGIKCMVKCSLEKWNVLKKDGTIDEAVALQTLKDMENLKNSKIDFAKVLTTCKDMKGANECDSAYQKAHCLVKEGVLIYT